MGMFQEIFKTLIQSEVFWTVVFIVVVALISLIVKKTKTTKDDQIWAMVVNAFNIAEKLIPDGQGPAFLQKADNALKTFNEEYFKRFGANPPDDLQQFAKDQWSKLAFEIKK